ncbi:MAG: DUF2752 domain-containing protein [Clostridia bacterium]|nr:DUF2752 domain-containing protein [Clostridia bacterium]
MCLDAVLLVGFFLSGLLSRWMLFYLPECLFFRMGILCPACGGTRVVESLSRFDFCAAFSYNPMIFLTLCYLLVLVVLLNLGYVFHKPFAQKGLKRMANRKVLYSLVLFYVAFGVFRNLM